MNPQEISEQIKAELAQICAIHLDTIRNDGWLIEYGLDSLRSMELIINLEERFDIEIPDDEIATVTTVQDVINLIQQQLLVVA